MNVDGAQRWRGGRASYRPAGEVIDTRRFVVSPIDGPGADNIAHAFVVENHYSSSYPAARERIGLYRGGALVGVAVFSYPAQDKVLGCLPCPKSEAVELGRLVLLDDVPANGESWFIARTFELLRARGYAGVVSFADPVRVFSERTRSKIRARERGWRHAVDQLVEHGATPPERTGEAADLAAWLPGALKQVTRTLKHTGNLRYLFGLTPTMKRLVASSMSYPPQPYPQISVPRPRP